MIRIILVIAVFFIAFAADCRAEPARRALVIGNDSYLNLRKLERARNDARAVAEALRSLDFQVIEGADLDRSGFDGKLTEFQNALQTGDIAAFFFAGHGVEIDNENYLIPTDMPRYEPGDERLAKKDSFSVQDFLTELQSKGTQINIVILDACRNNPFSDSAGRSVGGSRGLAKVDPPRGTFVLFSAAAHQEALDRLPGADEDSNSLFTRHLLPQLAVPNLNIVEMAKLVQVAVAEQAKDARKAQEPAYYDNIIGHFFLKQTGDGDGGPVPSPGVKTVSPAAQQETARADEKADVGDPPAIAKERIEPIVSPEVRGEEKYLECVRKNDKDSPCYREFLAEFPGHGRADQVRAIIAEQVELPLYEECVNATGMSKILIHCKAYETRFPGGAYIDDVRNRIQSAKAASEPPAAAAVQEENEPGPEEQAVVTAPPSLPSPAFRQFTTYNGFDLPGGDYGSPLKDISQDRCQSVCADDQQCVAYTYDKRNAWCFLKSQITGLDANEKAISGVVASANAPSAPRVRSEAQSERSFRTYEDFDVPGGDYRSPRKNVDFGDCRNACAGDTSCVAFTFNRRHRWCFLKSSATRLKPDGQATSGVLSSINLDQAQPSQGSDMKLYPGMDFAGRDLDPKGVQSTSLEECQTICTSNPSCNAFSWVKKNGWCWPKSDVARPKRRSGVISGRRL